MARQRCYERDRAFEIWKESFGNARNCEIATILDVDQRLVATWKSRDRWAQRYAQLNDIHRSEHSDSIKSIRSDIGSGSEKKRNKGKKRGAPYGNRNAVGNKGGAPKGNQNAVAFLMPEKIPDEIEALVAAVAQADAMTILRQQCAVATVLEYMQLQWIQRYEYEWENADNFQDRSIIGVQVLRLENALTRTQDLIRKLVATEHRIDMDKQKLELDKKGTSSYEKNAEYNI